MAIFFKIPCFSLYIASLLLFSMSFSVTSFAKDSETNAANRIAALASRIVSESDGMQTMDSVYTSYQINEFNVRGFSARLQLTHHKVGRVIRLFENGLAEVRWDFKDGLSTDETEYLNIKVLKRKISSYDEFYVGKSINYYSDYARIPFTFEGTVKRVFAGGQIEVEWNTRNKKEKKDRLGISYWSASELRHEQKANLGKILPNESRILMALTSMERGSKKVVPDYLKMIEQIVLSRGNSICRISGFKGLASYPQVEPLNHHNGLEAYLPLGESLVEDVFYRDYAWTWSHQKIKSSRAAGVGVVFGSLAAALGGLAAAPFTGGVSAIVGLGAFYVTAIGGGVELAIRGGVQGHLSYPRVLERNESGKAVELDIELTGKKISPLVFKEIRCAETSDERLKFDTSWIFGSFKSKAVAAPEIVPTPLVSKVAEP
ncbi:MAG: hypothetical protein ABI041_19730, partial [Bdellovibrionia bacterium]